MAGEGERVRPPDGAQGEKTLPASNIRDSSAGRRAGRKQDKKWEACFLNRDTRVRIRGKGECMAGKGERMRPPDGAQGEKTLPASNIMERFVRRETRGEKTG